MAALKTVFFDSNILFSAALGGPAFEMLWELARNGRIRLMTSQYCRLEAAANLERKRPAAFPRLEALMSSVGYVPEASEEELRHAQRLLPENDAPVLASAIAANADLLLTGDLKHFGAMMERTGGKIRVRTLRRFLLEGP